MFLVTTVDGNHSLCTRSLHLAKAASKAVEHKSIPSDSLRRPPTLRAANDGASKVKLYKDCVNRRTNELIVVLHLLPRAFDSEPPCSSWPFCGMIQVMQWTCMQGIVVKLLRWREQVIGIIMAARNECGVLCRIVGQCDRRKFSR